MESHKPQDRKPEDHRVSYEEAAELAANCGATGYLAWDGWRQPPDPSGKILGLEEAFEKIAMRLVNRSIEEEKVRLDKFIGSLQFQSPIGSINLIANHLNYKDAWTLYDILKEEQLTRLNLANNQLRDEGAWVVAQLIKIKLSKLTRINLANNEISIRGGQHLLHAIKDNMTIMQLELKGNPIPENTLVLIQYYLKRNRTALSSQSSQDLSDQKSHTPRSLSPSTSFFSSSSSLSLSSILPTQTYPNTSLLSTPTSPPSSRISSSLFSPGHKPKHSLSLTQTLTITNNQLNL